MFSVVVLLVSFW